MDVSFYVYVLFVLIRKCYYRPKQLFVSTIANGKLSYMTYDFWATSALQGCKFFFFFFLWCYTNNSLGSNMITTKEGVDTTQLIELLALFSYKSLRKNYCIRNKLYDLIDPVLLL